MSSGGDAEASGSQGPLQWSDHMEAAAKMAGISDQAPHIKIPPELVIGIKNSGGGMAADNPFDTCFFRSFMATAAGRTSVCQWAACAYMYMLLCVKT